MLKKTIASLACTGLFISSASPLLAQLGSGWTPVTFSTRFEYETNDVLKTISPPPLNFNDPSLHYDTNTSTTVQTFNLLKHTSNRAEIRPNDDYSSGSRQFEADVLISTTTTTNECIHQIFNGPTGPWMLFRENPRDSTRVAVWAGSSLPLFTNNFGVWFHMNSINSLVTGRAYLYCNGQLVWQGSNPGGTFYTKYGLYGTHSDANVATIQFKNVKLYSGGNTNGAGDYSGIYKLQNVASGLVLNNQGSLTNGSKITQWSSSSTSVNLQWTFIPTSGGYYQINCVKSGLDAVVQSASTAAGAGIIQWNFGAAGNDQWLPMPNSGGSFTFINLHSGLVLADPGGSTSTSTQMDQEADNDGSNQKWLLLPQ